MSLFSKEALERMEREEQGLRKRTLLIVDDEEHNLTTLKYVLANHYDVLTASDGQEALQLLEKDPDPSRVHMIISDQRMPRMTGVEFLTHSIAITPSTIRVVLTGFTDVEAIMDSINQAKIYKFVLKPFDEHDILLTVKRGLELYDLEEKNRKLVETLEFFNGRFFSHTRGILQNVSASTELLARTIADTLSRDQEQLLAQIGSSTNTLVHLFNRASELSYVYTGDRPAQMEQLDVLELIRETGNAFLSGLETADLTLNYSWDLDLASSGEDAVFHIEADRELLCKALEELLDNGFTYAVKPTQISVRTAIRDHHFCIEVRDRGIGLENEGGSGLLRPFARGERCGEFQQFGFGIGLANAKAFMVAQNGDLFFTQEENGSSVMLTIPLPAYGREDPLGGDAPRQRIAVFQEDSEELDRLRQVLEFEGHEVSAFATPRALLDSFPALRPHLVILDASCGGKSTEAETKALSEFPQDEPAPVVILAGDPAPADEKAYLDCGATTFVVKPVDYARLTALVQQLL